MGDSTQQTNTSSQTGSATERPSSTAEYPPTALPTSSYERLATVTRTDVANAQPNLSAAEERPQWPTDIDHLATLLRDAALDEAGARLLVAHVLHPHKPATTTLSMDPSTVRMESSSAIDGWAVDSFTPRVQDVDFCFEVSFYDRVPTRKSRKGQLQSILGRIVFDPQSDFCVVYNAGGWPFSIRKITSQNQSEPQKQDTLYCADYDLITPGCWGVYARAVGPDGGSEALACLRLGHRHFEVSFHGGDGENSTKRRCSPEASLRPRKRAKVDRGENRDYPRQLTPYPMQDRELQNIQDRKPSLADLQIGQLTVVRAMCHKTDITTDDDSYQLTATRYVARSDATVVFAGFHSKWSIEIAIKLLRPNVSAARTVAAWDRRLGHRATTWFREKAILQRLKHRNIVFLYGFDARLHAFYLELLPKVLSGLPRADLSRGDHLQIARDIASALGYMAGEGIIHCDVKAGNIAYSPERGAVLLDFGLAVDNSVSTRLTGGTIWYLPPEWLDKGHVSGAAGDVWALGVTMLYLLGLITFPDDKKEMWCIFAAHEEPRSEAGAKMENWLRRVEKARQMLTKEDALHSVVDAMLDTKKNTRITAKEIEERLRAS